MTNLHCKYAIDELGYSLILQNWTNPWLGKLFNYFLLPLTLCVYIVFSICVTLAKC